jgi:hypothetical protein
MTFGGEKATKAPWDPVAGEVTIGAWRALGGAPEPEVLMVGRDLSQGELSALVSAEMLVYRDKAARGPNQAAARAPAADLLPQLLIGGARENLDDDLRAGRISEETWTLYRATHATALALHTSARGARRPGAAKLIDGFGVEVRPAYAPVLGLGVGAAVVISVIGTAAVCALAWYAKETKEASVRADTEQAKALAGIDTLNKLALGHLEKGLPVPADLIRQIGALAQTDVERETMGGLGWGVAIGAGVVGLGAAYVWGRS